MSAIEWTEKVWNPTVGCSAVSPGCDRCYAAGVAHRGLRPEHKGLTVRSDAGIEWTGEVRILSERLDQPLRWGKPRRVFVDSMSDLFHPDVPNEFIVEVFARMLAAPRHTFQVLTKRPQRMAGLLDDPKFALEVGYTIDEWFPDDKTGADYGPWLDAERRIVAGGELFPNVWLGVSIESDTYTWRAVRLRKTPAAVRFLSLEPLIGPLPSLDLTGIDWVIIGGESGPGARPMQPDWVADLIADCYVAGVPVFMKQTGAALAGHWRLADRRKGGDPDEWPAWMRQRDYPLRQTT